MPRFSWLVLFSRGAVVALFAASLVRFGVVRCCAVAVLLGFASTILGISKKNGTQTTFGIALLGLGICVIAFMGVARSIGTTTVRFRVTLVSTQSHTPISGTRVAILNGDNRVLAVGTTDSKGTALLSFRTVFYEMTSLGGRERVMPIKYKLVEIGQGDETYRVRLNNVIGHDRVRLAGQPVELTVSHSEKEITASVDRSEEINQTNVD